MLAINNLLYFLYIYKEWVWMRIYLPNDIDESRGQNLIGITFQSRQKSSLANGSVFSLPIQTRVLQRLRIPWWYIMNFHKISQFTESIKHPRLLEPPFKRTIIRRFMETLNYSPLNSNSLSFRDEEYFSMLLYMWREFELGFKSRWMITIHYKNHDDKVRANNELV